MSISNREACLHFLKRYAEALFIAAFILADCCLSGWALSLVSTIAVIFVIWPALLTLPALTASGRIAYLSAFVKTPRLQKLAILLVWIYAIRWFLSAAVAAHLWHGQTPTVGTAIFMAVETLSDLGFMADPLIIYVSACAIAIALRSRLKASKQDPDLIKQRQTWAGITHVLFMGAYTAAVLAFSAHAHSPARWLAGWLLASARGANMFSGWAPHWATASPSPYVLDLSVLKSDYVRLPAVDPSHIFSNGVFQQPFEQMVIAIFSLVLFLLLWQPAIKLSAFLTSFSWRVLSPLSLQNYSESFLETMHLPTRSLDFKQRHPFWTNAWRSLVWIFGCYALLFWLFGFCGGPLGQAIEGFLLSSGIFLPSPAADAQLRIFFASYIALISTGTFAVTAVVFLPYARPRQITINSDGLLFSQGPLLSLWGRQFRLWSDLESMTMKQATFTLHFRSGGSVAFNNRQVSAKNLRVLLDAIDQHAVACSIDKNVLSVLQELVESDREGSGVDEVSIKSISAQNFKSTVFVPFSPGELLPGTDIRIIRQLSSKPLCAVYLARMPDDQMASVKQFYLAEDTQESRAFAKILQREYELLCHLDHPGIAKVINSYSADRSTFLIVEHRLGSDLRSIVEEHGGRSENVVITWAKQLCEIMIYLHGLEPPILHRDLTPDNIILGEDGQLRVIDFGAAREFLEGITGTMIGKQCYVAPEQLRGEASQRSDIYTFGATLHFLLTGQDPVALSQSSPAKIISCSDQLDALVRDCTNFEEGERLSSFQEVRQRLHDLDRGLTLKLHSREKETV